jgi:hypothetical protein
MRRRRLSQKHSLLQDLKWMAILWCVGVGAAMLLALPFHLMVAALTRH